VVHEDQLICHEEQCDVPALSFKVLPADNLHV
jgi:hypothetical protein